MFFTRERIDGHEIKQEEAVAKQHRGFAAMNRMKQREIASMGGKAAHLKGTAHEWTTEEARQAGHKGGVASHRQDNSRHSDTESAVDLDNAEEPVKTST